MCEVGLSSGVVELFSCCCLGRAASSLSLEWQAFLVGSLGALLSA